MPEGGALRIQAGNRLFDENFESLAPEAKAGAYVAFTFTDTGHGIDRSILPRVAEPFFTTKEDGSGIGLSLSRQIMRLHGGGVSVRSTPGAYLGLDGFPDAVTAFTLRF